MESNPYHDNIFHTFPLSSIQITSFIPLAAAQNANDTKPGLPNIMILRNFASEDFFSENNKVETTPHRDKHQIKPSPA